MELLLVTLVSFPTVIFTVLLGVIVFYWLFVVVGGASHNILGDGAADGAVDGLAGDGAVEGAAKGMVEGAAKGMVEGAAESLDFDASGGHGEAGHGDAGHGDGSGDGHGSGLGGILAALRLRSAPATVVLSLIVTFSWLVSTLTMEAVVSTVPDLSLPIGFGVLVFAPLLSLLPTSVLVRPLGQFFTTHEAPRHRELVGKICRVRTGRVTSTFGEAIIDGNGAELVIRIRVDAGEPLARGEEALIVEFDEVRDAFLVAPLRGVMGSSK